MPPECLKINEGIMTRVYLVRHGENKANITKEFSSRKVDYPLTPKGRLQAEQTAAVFKKQNIHAIFSSPLKRAVETAVIIAKELNLEVTVLENFRELDVGDLEDMPPTTETWQIHYDVIKDWLSGKLDSSFPNGENYFQAFQRMIDGLEQVVDQMEGKNVLISGHGGIFFTVMGELCPHVNILELIQKINHNCSITEIMIAWENGKLVGELVSWADVSHLHGDAADLVLGFPEEN
jgi:broad specificity phosphatase PhoE